MKERSNYYAPESELVEIAFKQALLDGSFNGDRQSYGTAETDTWGE